jgi:flagellar biosynthesis protein FliR
VTVEVFMAVKIQVEVFWVVMPCNVVVGYHCLAVRLTEICVSFHNSIQHHNPEYLDLNVYYCFSAARCS